MPVLLAISGCYAYLLAKFYSLIQFFVCAITSVSLILRHVLCPLSSLHPSLFLCEEKFEATVDPLGLHVLLKCW